MVDQIQGTGSMMGPRGQFNSQPLTEDQKTQIQTILSQYDPKNVTAEDAKSIFQAFRDAGIKPARGMKEVIETAGFDADALREMARPEDASSKQGTTSASASKINLSALKSLQDILSQFNLSNMTADDQTGLLGKLQTAGFLNTGSVIDLKS